MDRIETVRQIIDEILRSQPEPGTRRAGFIHLYGVAATCGLLAMRRGLRVSLAIVMGMLHDLAVYKGEKTADHAARGAAAARPILERAGGFTPEEITLVAEAIRTHSDKAGQHGRYAELLKDADVLQHHLYNPTFSMAEVNSERLARVLAELGVGDK